MQPKTNDIWVVCESDAGGLRGPVWELIAQAQRLSEEGGAQVVAVAASAEEGDPSELEGQVDRLLVLENPDLVPFRADPWVEVLGGLIEDYGPALVLFPEGVRARDVIPRLAVRAGGRAVTNGVDLSAAGDGSAGYKVGRPVVGGKAYASFTLEGERCFAAFRPNSFDPTPAGGRGTEVEKLEAGAGEDRVEIVERAVESTSEAELTEAQVVVSGGRGMKDPDNLALLEELAEALDGAVGVSRAVVDAGWAEHAQQVGKSGKTVSPILYFAFGISGAIHHIMGMDTAKVVVAVNSDESAPIFDHADYGIVGNALDVIPELTRQIREAAR